ncbi:HNH endonuclease signature motif containing protein [Kribbella rubisoli]|nr:HNH endonuclease signature motif containing protein [Kribbella rubisoli]
MELLGERPIWSMSDSELLPTIDQVEAAVTRLLTYRLLLIARVDEVGLAPELGARDTAELLAMRHRIDRRDAHRDVKLSGSLAKYEAVSTALADETRPLRPAQASAIVTALERVRSRVAVEDLEVAEEQLVNLAAHLSPGDLAKAARQICDLLDSDGPEPDENAAYARESLTLVEAENGVKFRGYLANENAELLRSRIHAAARPHKTLDGELDPRSREKRQADALTATLTVAAAATETGYKPPTPATHPTNANPASHPNPAPANSRTANASPGPRTADASPGSRAAETSPGSRAGDAGSDSGAGEASPGSRAGEAGDGSRAGEASGGARPADVGAEEISLGRPAGDGVVDGVAGGSVVGGAGCWVPGFGAKANITVTIDFEDLKSAAADATGELVYGDGLSAAAIRRLACDAKIIPLVLGVNSEPLDVGRAERLVTRAMRRALNVRDKGCVVCGAPPIHCDAHHLRSWIDGGETAIHNLVLLCRAHHRALHDGHWVITITNGHVQVSRPTWADPPPQPTPPISILLASPTLRPDTPAQPPDDRTAAAPATGPATGPATRRRRTEGRSGRRASRWSADETLMHEAAHFAVWGESAATDAPDSVARTRETPSNSSDPIHPDPWADTALI